MEIQEIRERIMELSGKNEGYYKKVIPGMSKTYGVKIPELRKLAKEIAKDDYKAFLNSNPMDSFEMETLQAFVIGYAKDDINIILEYFEAFIPKIHDWSVNDSLCQNFKIARKYPQQVFEMLSKYFESDKEYEVRVVAVTLMSHYLNDTYIERVVKILDGLKCDTYYSKMGVAWAVATVMAKYRDVCFDYLEKSNLDDWTYNKAIQKMIESYRVSDEDKIILRTMKR